MSRKTPTLDPLTSAQLQIGRLVDDDVKKVRDYCTVLLQLRAPKATRQARTPKAQKANGKAQQLVDGLTSSLRSNLGPALVGEKQ